MLGELAAGGMATVYVGRLAGAGGFARRIAIKSLHAQFAKDPDFLAMFLDEARLSGRIQHPNVVRVLDVISSENELHLVMEYIEGESLSKLVRLLHARGERVPVAISLAILIGVLDGLHAAHEALGEDGHALQIVHRDVSPQNVLVGVDGMPRILDFGIAKAVGRMQTTRGDQLKGKLAYMAPEHLAREALDRRADVYAAGILLWELFTGDRLFQADDEISTFRRALEAKVAAPSSVAAGLPASLDRVVLRALAKQPEARYQTAHDFSLELEKTGLAASARDLSLWVQQTAEQSLAERAARIATYEAVRDRPSGSASARADEADDAFQAALPRALSDSLRAQHADTAVVKPAVGLEPAPTQRRPMAPQLALFVLGIAAIVALLVWRSSAANIAGEPSSSVGLPNKAAVAPASAAEIPTPSVPAPGSPKVSAPAASPAQSGAVAEVSGLPPAISKTAKGGGAAPGGKRRRRPDCETPFTVDARGIRVPKLECL